MPHQQIVPALAAGNTVVFKPSEETPLCGQAYADALLEVLPAGVLHVVHGADEQGKAMVASDVDQTISLAQSRQMASLIPGARFEIVEGASHIGASVQDPRVMRLVADFLGDETP